MKLLRVKELPTREALLPANGLEQYLLADLHIHILRGGGSDAWRIAVRHSDEKYIAEGNTAQEAGDAVFAIIKSIYDTGRPDTLHLESGNGETARLDVAPTTH